MDRLQPSARIDREIILTLEERRELEAFTKGGKKTIKLYKRAEIILALDTSGGRIPDKEKTIAGRLGVSRQIV